MKAVINLFQGHFHQLKGDLEGSKKIAPSSRHYCF